MSYYQDLTPYEYLHARPDNHVLNIGWLDASYPYQKGSVSDEILGAILKICENPVSQTRGFHVCPFCKYPTLGVIVQTSGKQITLGTAEIRVTGESARVYAAPDLIYHYMKDHEYLPPNEFLQAVTSIASLKNK